MEQLTDDELLNEFKIRMKKKNQANSELRKLLFNLETVNKKLENSEKLKTNFTSNIRNEINNPLAAIMGFSKLITFEPLDIETIKDFSAQIYTETLKLDFHLHNIFAAADLEAGNSQIMMVEIDISKFIKNIIDTYNTCLNGKEVKINYKTEKNKNLSLKNKCRDDIDKFKTDSEKLILIIRNLINNAVEYSKNDSTVEIKSKLLDNALIVTVQNYGSILNEKDGGKIFERFRQLDFGTTKEHQGLGLGLSVSKAFAELLRGELSFTSSKIEGTIFTLRIPELVWEKINVKTGTEENELFFDEFEVF